MLCMENCARSGELGSLPRPSAATAACLFLRQLRCRSAKRTRFMHLTVLLAVLDALPRAPDGCRMVLVLPWQRLLPRPGWCSRDWLILRLPHCCRPGTASWQQHLPNIRGLLLLLELLPQPLPGCELVQPLPREVDGSAGIMCAQGPWPCTGTNALAGRQARRCLAVHRACSNMAEPPLEQASDSSAGSTHLDAGMPLPLLSDIMSCCCCCIFQVALPSGEGRGFAQSWSSSMKSLPLYREQQPLLGKPSSVPMADMAASTSTSPQLLSTRIASQSLPARLSSVQQGKLFTAR